MYEYVCKALQYNVVLFLLLSIQFMVIGLRSQLIKQYDWSEKKQLKSWKAHMSPIMAMTFDPSSTLLATGSADSTVKVWDCTRNYCTHNLCRYTGEM